MGSTSVMLRARQTRLLAAEVLHYHHVGLHLEYKHVQPRIDGESATFLNTNFFSYRRNHVNTVDGKRLRLSNRVTVGKQGRDIWDPGGFGDGL